jgi:hypothetical protein
MLNIDISLSAKLIPGTEVRGMGTTGKPPRKLLQGNIISAGIWNVHMYTLIDRLDTIRVWQTYTL